MSISLSMIVKNEERDLSRCLDSVKDLVNEIIIVDTGSTDNTIEIAKKYTSKIYNFNWVNDFSSARNFANSKTTKEWILYLDADEWITQKKIELPFETDIGALNCTVLNYGLTNSDNVRMKYPRLFKKNEDIYFEGSAHEQIIPSLIKSKFKIADSDILIYHDGYSKSEQELKSKAKRNLDLLLKDSDCHEQAYYQFQIANSYKILKDEIQANNYFKKLWNNKRAKPEQLIIAAYSLIEFNLNNNSLPIASKFLNQALTIDENNPLLNLYMSVLYEKTGDYKKSLLYADRAYEHNKLNSNSKSKLDLDIILNDRKIIYKGLSIALQTEDSNKFNKFLNALNAQDEDGQKEFELITNLVRNREFKPKNISFITEQGTDFYSNLLRLPGNDTLKSEMLLLLNKMYPYHYNTMLTLGLKLIELKQFSHAEEFLIKAYQTDENNPTVLFYIISSYFEQGKNSEIKELIREAKSKFNMYPVVIEKLEKIENMLKSSIN